MRRITKREKREFIRRCKTLSMRNGLRVRYRPARWLLVLDELRIYWHPDEDFFHARLEKLGDSPMGVSRTRIVNETRGVPVWGYVHKVHHHLELLRRLMILEDLADI